MSEKDLVLYYFPECPFCQIVLDKIDALGIVEKIKLKNINTDSVAEEFHINTTGRRTVPCLYIYGSPMFESADINAWLETNQANL